MKEVYLYIDFEAQIFCTFCKLDIMVVVLIFSEQMEDTRYWVKAQLSDSYDIRSSAFVDSLFTVNYVGFSMSLLFQIMFAF